MAEQANGPYLKGDKPAPKKSVKSSDWWRKEIARSIGGKWKEYRERAQKVVERYRDERDMLQVGTSKVKFNILYANVETLRPAVYSHVPSPDVRRRFSQADPVGRIASDVLQKGLSFGSEKDLGPTLSGCVQDYTLPGFATARVKYVPKFGKGDEILDESCPAEHVGWDCFAMSRSRSWERVWWVAFREDLTKDEYIEAFGEKSTDAAAFTYSEEKDRGGGAEGEDGNGKARVWEVWDRRARERFFVAEGGKGYVKEPEPDPLQLEDFFPCPRPLWAISTTGTLIPVPEYLEYQDLALELDDVTQRIHVLTGAIRRRGFYDGSLKDQLSNVGNQPDNHFEPIDDWARFVDKGGLAQIIAEMPLDNIIKARAALYEDRAAIIQTIYQVTGMADIVRGASNPNETATAQQIKGRYAGLRLGEKQAKFQEFARDIMRLKAEIIAEHFQLDTLKSMSGVELLTQAEKAMFTQAQATMQAQAQQAAMMAQQTGQQPPPPPQMPPDMAKAAELMAQPSWEEVVAILKSDKLRGFKVDVETDSTIQPNADEERQQRIDLLTSVTGFLGTAAPLVQQGMLSADLVKELALFGIRSFKTAPAVETALEAIGSQTPLPPHIQQAQQQLQAQTQQLQAREAAVQKLEAEAAKAKNDAVLAQERAMRQESEAGWAKRTLELVESFQKQMDALNAKHDQELRRTVESAESAVEEAMAGLSAMPPPAAPLAPEAPKPVKAAPINITVNVDGKPKGGRKMRMMDAPDGSTTIEELMEEAGEAPGEEMTNG